MIIIKIPKIRKLIANKLKIMVLIVSKMRKNNESSISYLLTD